MSKNNLLAGECVISNDPGKFNAHLLLYTFDSPENFLEHRLIDMGKMFRINKIVSLAGLLGYCGDLADKPQVHEITI